jgi:uncharacterized metal-binding protein
VPELVLACSVGLGLEAERAVEAGSTDSPLLALEAPHARGALVALLEAAGIPADRHLCLTAWRPGGAGR